MKSKNKRHIFTFFLILQINIIGVAQDTIAPVAKCLNTVVDTFPPFNKGYVLLNAKFFNKNSHDETTFIENLKFSFSENINDTLKAFCNEKTEEIRIYIWDEANNYSYCDSKLCVQRSNAHQAFPCCECYGDTIPPVAVCKDTVIVELYSNGKFYIYPDLFANESYDNVILNGKKIIGYSPWQELGCEDLGFLDVKIIVYDGEHNSDACTSVLNLTDPNNYCNTASSKNYQPEIDLKFHPNPAALETHILNADQFNKIQVINLNGDVICKFEDPDKNLIINTAHMNNGIYFIRGINEGKLTVSKKLIVNH